MNHASLWLAALQQFVPLILQIGIVAGSAALVQRIVPSALWRRIVWQISLVGVFVVTICEVSGCVGTARRWFERNVPSSAIHSTGTGAQTLISPKTATRGALQLSEEFRHKVIAQIDSKERAEMEAGPETFENSASANSVLPPAPMSPSSTFDAVERDRASGTTAFAGETSATEFLPASWLALVWLAGTCAIAIRILLGRVMFSLFHLRFRQLEDAALRLQIGALAKQVGISGTIHMKASQRLTGPVAFGLIKRTVALPSDFLAEFNPTQRDAMLAHELAHLAAGDSAWQLFSDCVVALLWWHPLVWWMKRQLLTAAESAADEASMLVANGPNALAECLVALGGRLTQPKSPGWVGIEGNGFRSGLARRINRLITLQGSS
ncbi:MAG: M56 family metallopeptidase, partial [Verrucomicrobia bacterium]|nr:M56 family metallopeptidase [Verrucomicrobiota bacterium]